MADEGTVIQTLRAHILLKDHFPNVLQVFLFNTRMMLIRLKNRISRVLYILLQVHVIILAR